MTAGALCEQLESLAAVVSNDAFVYRRRHYAAFLVLATLVYVRVALVPVLPRACGLTARG